LRGGGGQESIQFWDWKGKSHCGLEGPKNQKKDNMLVGTKGGGEKNTIKKRELRKAGCWEKNGCLTAMHKELKDKSIILKNIYRKDGQILGEPLFTATEKKIKRKFNFIYYR